MERTVGKPLADAKAVERNQPRSRGSDPVDNPGSSALFAIGKMPAA